MFQKAYEGVVWVLAYCLMLLLLPSCATDTAPGTFSVTFQWEDPPPEETSTLGVWGKVEREGLQLAESSVLAYTDGVTLDFSDVPNSSGLMIIVDIKETVNKSSRTLYYGRSDTFELKAGKHIDVPVSLSLVSTPLSAEGAVSIVEELGDGSYVTLSYTNQTKVTLALSAPANCNDPCTVLVSNTSEFRSIEEDPPSLDSLEKDGDRYLKSSWDLNLEAVDVDGQRTVYVKFRNADGYESDVATGRVTVDRLAPVVTGSVSPASARIGTPIQIVANVNEALLDGYPVLYTDPPVELDEPQQSGLSTIWTVTVDSNRFKELDYTFSVKVMDLAGNSTEANVTLGTLTVDATGPVVTEAVIRKGDTYDEAVELGGIPVLSGVSLWVDIEFDTALVAPPLAMLNDLELNLATTKEESGTSFRYTYTLDGNEGDVT